MNADLKRVREGGLEDSSSPAKRRAMTLSTPSAGLTEQEDDKLEDWMKVVEVGFGHFLLPLETMWHCRVPTYVSWSPQTGRPYLEHPCLPIL